MNNKNTVKNLGELQIIKIIENLIYEKTGKKLIRDDSFFFPLNKVSINLDNKDSNVVFNSDMLVSTTDVPPQMNYYQIGRKAVLMNLSDLIVKGVEPKGIFISFGLNNDLKLGNFKELMYGIIDSCSKWDIEYIGGDLNESIELIINPAVFGFQDHSKIIYRTGLKPGDYLMANGKFGLTGVGFDILLKQKSGIKKYPQFERSIKAVLEPSEISREALILSKENYATSSIDSSDGLAKSLTDLIDSNPNSNIGFEIELNEQLIDKEAFEYSKKYDVSLEKLVFSGGEEFIHLFTINPKSLDPVQNAIQANGYQIFKIGR
ncbi:MAG: thiamine-phosphate kinase, partial [Promethearchaeota archaeon]